MAKLQFNSVVSNAKIVVTRYITQILQLYTNHHLQFFQQF